MAIKQDLVRISVMIRKDQHDTLVDKSLNLSGYIRDVIDDNLFNDVISINVNTETKDLYDQVISNSGGSDTDLEPYLRKALKEMLERKIEEMKKLHEQLK